MRARTKARTTSAAMRQRRPVPWALACAGMESQETTLAANGNLIAKAVRGRRHSPCGPAAVAAATAAARAAAPGTAPLPARREQKGQEKGVCKRLASSGRCDLIQTHLSGGSV